MKYYGFCGADDQKRMEYHNRYPTAIWFQRNEKITTMTAQVCRIYNNRLERSEYMYEVHDIATSTPFKPALKGFGLSLSEAKKSVFEYFGATGGYVHE